MKIEEVPELTLPIIKPNRDYFCQYCDKVCGNSPLGGELSPSPGFIQFVSAYKSLAGFVAFLRCLPATVLQYCPKKKEKDKMHLNAN